MHAATRLIGNVVRVQTASGKVWEGERAHSFKSNLRQIRPSTFKLILSKTKASLKKNLWDMRNVTPST